MNTKTATIFIVIIIAVIEAVIAFFPQQKISQNPPLIKSTEITPPPATGKIDDLVNATLSEILDEEQLLKEEENDTSLVTSDKQEISDFGQTINESEF